MSKKILKIQKIQKIQNQQNNNLQKYENSSENTAIFCVNF